MRSIAQRYPGQRFLTFAAAFLTILPFILPSSVTAQEVAKTTSGLHGRVFELDASGDLVGPLGGAQLEFKDQSGKILAQTKSESSGYYRVVLPPGVYFYKLQATGFRDEDVGRGVSLKISEGFAVYNFSLVRGSNDPTAKPAEPVTPPVPTGRLAGRVYEKVDDRTSRGIPGAKITLRGVDPVGQTMDVVSGSDGNYQVVLPAGTWKASVSAADYATFVDPEPIETKSNETVTRDFALAAASSAFSSEQGIQGTIQLQTRDDGTGDESQIDISIYKLGQAEKPIARVVNNAPGNYTHPLPIGTYQVLAQCQGYQPAISSPRAVLGGSYTTVDLMLTPLAKTPESEAVQLLTTVYEQSGDDVIGRRPLPSAMVVVRKPGESLEQAHRQQTDEKGEAIVSAVEVGSYDVLAYKEGYQSAGIQFHVAASGTNHAELTLERSGPSTPTPPPEPATPLGGRLHVWVVEQAADGEVAASGDANVRVLRNGQGVGNGYTDGRGAFITDFLEPGQLQVVVSKEGFPVSQNLVSISDRDQLLDVMLAESPQTLPTDPDARPTGPPTTRPDSEDLRLTVDVVGGRDGREIPLPGADVFVLRGDTTVAAGKAQNQGRFSADIDPGSFQIIAEYPGYQMARVNVTVASSDLQQRIVMQPDTGPRDPDQFPPESTRPTSPDQKPPTEDREFAKVTFTTFADRGDGGGQPLDNVDIYLQRDDQTVGNGKTNARGQFSVDLAAGGYRVIAELPGYHPTTFDLDVGRQDLQRQIVLRSVELPPTESDPDLPPPESVRPPSEVPRPTEPGEPGLAGPTLTVVAVTERDGRRQVLPGADVFVIQSQQTVGQGKTDEQGQFSVRVRAGAGVVFAERPGYEFAKVDLEIGQQDLRRELMMRPVGTPGPMGPGEPIPPQGPRPQGPRPPDRPSVTPETPILTLQLSVVQRDQRGVRPVPGPQIEILRGEVPFAHGQADPGGQFLFRLPAGTYSVHVRHEGFREYRQPITLANRNLHQQVVLSRLDQPGVPTPKEPRPTELATANIQVVERGPGGGFTPIFAANVSINFAGKTVKQGETNRVGQFTAQLQRGLYAVSANKPGYHSNGQSLDLSRGDTVARVILFREVRPEPFRPEPFRPEGIRPIPSEQLKRPGAPPTMQVDWQLAVSERGPDGGMFPVPAAMVEVRRGQTVVFDGATDPQGRLRTQLPIGQLQLTVRKGGYQTHQQPLEIQDKPRRTDVTLRRGQ